MAVFPAFCLAAPKALAASGHGLSPEVSAKVWQDDAAEVATVTLNGKELITFRGESNSGSAAEKAEDLASKLEELFDNKSFAADELLPSRAGTALALQIKGANILTIDPSGAVDGSAESSGFETAFKLTNKIRSAYGTRALPPSYLKFATQTPQESLAAASMPNAFSGKASWYGPHFHGKRTSDGHRFDQEGMTAAHRSLPFGTKLLVMNRKTGNSCIVQINDRGPFIDGRIIDLSKGAARQLNMLGSGVTSVDCLVLGNEE